MARGVRSRSVARSATAFQISTEILILRSVRQIGAQICTIWRTNGRIWRTNRRVARHIGGQISGVSATLALKLEINAHDFRPRGIDREAIDLDVEDRDLPMPVFGVDPAVVLELTQRSLHSALRQTRPFGQRIDVWPTVFACFEIAERREG